MTQGKKVISASLQFRMLHMIDIFDEFLINFLQVHWVLGIALGVIDQVLQVPPI